jgi:hypothetical protein
LCFVEIIVLARLAFSAAAIEISGVVGLLVAPLWSWGLGWLS